MPAPEAFAYPLLLVAIYGVFRVGRARGPRLGVFEWTRLATLAALLGLVAAIQVRFAASGLLLSPVAMAAAVLSIAGVFGLVGLHALEVAESWRARRGALPGPPA